MYTFEYIIELNEFGRPVVVPSKRTDKELDLLEHKFLGLELSRAIITNTLLTHDKRPLGADEYERLNNVKLELESICDMFATSIKEQMNLMNQTKILLTPLKYDLQVDTINDLHNLNYNGIIYGENIFTRSEGLRVMVVGEKTVFELKGGIDNEHWTNTTSN